MTPEILVAWSGAFAAVAAALVALATLPFTRRAANAAQAQTQLQAQIAAESRRPLLWADIREHPEHKHVVCLFVGNNGPTTARDVHVTVEPPIRAGAQPLQCAEGQTAAAAGIAALPPGRVLEWWLGMSHELMAVPDQPKAFTLSITGMAADGTQLSDRLPVPFDDLRFASGSPGNMETFVQEFKHLRSERRADHRSLLQALAAITRDDPDHDE